MTISIRTLLAIATTALLASSVTYFATLPDRATASSTLTYRVHAGDYVAIPALDWTCALTRMPAVVFSCSTNDKPISEVTLGSKQIAVFARTKTGNSPVRDARNGYLFPYSHD